MISEKIVSTSAESGIPRLRSGAGAAAALISAVIYGLIPILTKIMYTQGANAVTVAFLRAAIASPVLLAMLVLKKIPMRLPISVFGRLFLFCGLPTSATMLFFNLACAYIPAGTVTSLNFIYPTAVTLANILFFHERVSIKRIAAILTGFSGVLLFFFNAADVSLSGLVFAVLSGVSYALLLIATEHTKIQHLHPLQIAFYQSLFVTLLLGPCSAATGILRLELPLAAWSLAVILSLLVSIAASVLLFFAVAETGSSTTALLSTLTPLISMTLGCVAFGELISFEKIIGMLLVLISVLLAGEFHRKLNPYHKTIQMTKH